MYHNIEKSDVQLRTYIGWDCNGCKYIIRKDGPRRDQGSWWVYPGEPGCIPIFYAATLKLVSKRLETRCSHSGG